MLKPLLPIALAAGLAACQSGADQVPSARLSVGVLDDMEGAQTLFGLSESSRIDDYSNVQLDLGMTTLGEDGMPSTRVSLEVGVTRLKEPGATLNSTEVALGGRLYGGVLNARTPMGGPTLPIQPFGLAQALLSFFELEGLDLGTQVGGRFGGGLQFALSDQAFFDMIVDYTIPFVEGNLGPLETEYSGLALRLGLGITF